MAEITLQDRLRDHAKAFDGLLSLIPAGIYYGKDTSDQWKRKKQTKEEAAAARRAKLDPDSVKSAKDVMEERARKRKHEEVDEFDVEGIEKELPKQGLKEMDKKKKKLRTHMETSAFKSKADIKAHDEVEQDDLEARNAKTERRRQKQQLRRDKLAKKTEKQKIRKAKSAEEAVGLAVTDTEIAVEGLVTEEGAVDTSAVDETAMAQDQMDEIDINGIAEEEAPESTASSTSEPASPIFDTAANPSTNTSTSSVVPPARAPKHIKMPTDPELLKARLAARIEALRAARKADGPNGAQPRNRQELMEARRKKEEQRRAHKKELRMKAKAEEEARREEALASSRDSPASNMMSPLIHGSVDNNFSFGRVAFADGQQLNDNLTGLLSSQKRKGPQDPATALLASEKKRQRLAGLDEVKRADIEEKDRWLAAKKRAQGEKVRDDTSLLKKTLKRKEKAKKKSEKEWSDRKDGVAKGQAMRQKKREENLKKRRDEKGMKGKGKKSGGGAKKGKPKVKARPGFEGSFTSGGKRRQR